MKTMARIALLAGALSLAACQRQPATDAPTPGPAEAGTPQSGALDPRNEPDPGRADPIAGENDGYPDLSPAPLKEDAAKGETGARAVLLSWARGVELREFDQSWIMMGDAAKAQLTKDAFNALFRPLRDLTVSIPGGSMEGAAGSSYYSAPTTVTGTRADGVQVELVGDVILRRINDIPGATPEQLQWHIERVELKPLSEPRNRAG